jgi:hypothetical protein
MLGGSAAPAVFAALLFLAAGISLLRTVFDGRLVALGLWMLAGAALSSAGVFAALLLPDMLAPLSILSVAVLFAFHDRLSGAGKLFWAALLVIGAVSHSTHLVVALFVLPIGLLLAAWPGRAQVLSPALWCGGALTAALLAGMGFTQAVQALYGYKPLPLPMIAASLITDEPGRSFLEENCPEAGYVFCDQLQTRATETDDFLWSRNPETGVYLFADGETRRAMSEQQFALLLDTLRHDWTGQMAISLGRFWRQLFDNGLGQTSYSDRQRQSIQKLPEPDRSIAVASGLYRGTVSFERFGQVTHFAALASALAAFATMTASWARGAGRHPTTGDAPLRALTVFTLLIFAGVLANSGLTGAFSQPQGRYAARVALLLPILAAVLGAWSMRNSVLFRPRRAEAV